MIAALFWLFFVYIIYVYAGYPLLVALLAFTRSKSHSQQVQELPSVTLLITAYNEQSIIGEKLENSLALDYPRDRVKIMVSADGSDDHTPEIVQTYADQGVELSYSPPRRGKMAAINRAMPLVKSEIVVFSDANNMYDKNVLRELVLPFADPTVGATTGAKSIIKGDGVLGDSEGLYWKYEAFIKERETRLGCCTSAAGEILAIRRNLFEPPPDNIINDDFYQVMRLIRRGYRIAYTPKARSFERTSLSAQDEIIRRTRIIAGRYQAIALAYKLLPPRRPLIAWQIISHKFLRPLVPLAMIGALLTNILAVVFPVSTTEYPFLHLASPMNWVMLILQVIFYGLAGIGKRVTLGGIGGKLLYLPTFLVNSNIAAVVGLFQFMARRHTTLWQRVQRREDH